MGGHINACANPLMHQKIRISEGRGKEGTNAFIRAEINSPAKIRRSGFIRSPIHPLISCPKP